jgi:hypothetical protein
MPFPARFRDCKSNTFRVIPKFAGFCSKKNVERRLLAERAGLAHGQHKFVRKNRAMYRAQYVLASASG